MDPMVGPNRAICDLKPFSNRSKIAAPSPSNDLIPEWEPLEWAPRVAPTRPDRPTDRRTKGQKKRMHYPSAIATRILLPND